MKTYRVEVHTAEGVLVSEECGSLEYARKLASEGLSFVHAKQAWIEMRTPERPWHPIEFFNLEEPVWV